VEAAGRLTTSAITSPNALYQIGGDTAGVPSASRRATLIAHLAWLALLIVGGGGVLVGAWRRRAAG